MKNGDTIEREAEKQYREKDKRKRKRMKVSGKSVFTLQKIINRNYDRLPVRKNRGKIRKNRSR